MCQKIHNSDRSYGKAIMEKGKQLVKHASSHPFNQTGNEFPLREV